MAVKTESKRANLPRCLRTLELGQRLDEIFTRPAILDVMIYVPVNSGFHAKGSEAWMGCLRKRKDFSAKMAAVCAESETMYMAPRFVLPPPEGMTWSKWVMAAADVVEHGVRALSEYQSLSYESVLAEFRTSDVAGDLEKHGFSLCLPFFLREKDDILAPGCPLVVQLAKQWQYAASDAA